MSEFKFACPVCGQHITSDAGASGGQIECPTCFQKIVVPQPPASAETKFILSASQVSKPRPVGIDTGSAPQAGPAPHKGLWVTILTVLGVIAFAAVAGVLFFPDKVLPALGVVPRGGWARDLKHAKFPDRKAAGKLRGHGFTAERSTLVGSTLSFREGEGAPMDMGVSIPLGHAISGNLSGKAVEITPEQQSNVPRITLSWLDEQGKSAKQVFEGGYALKLAFDQITNARAPGKIYLCLPDAAKSVMAGSFEAAVSKPRRPSGNLPKPKQPSAPPAPVPTP
ncbi:MAG TPA: hypothetical protein VMU04_12985 [Candidatus Acidoferrum sp.]|nr:hypothetical protein [Candidatus Acidoferrum sp.]